MPQGHFNGFPMSSGIFFVSEAARWRAVKRRPRPNARPLLRRGDKRPAPASRRPATPLGSFRIRSPLSGTPRLPLALPACAAPAIPPLRSGGWGPSSAPECCRSPSALSTRPGDRSASLTSPPARLIKGRAQAAHSLWRRARRRRRRRGSAHRPGEAAGGRAAPR